VAQARAETAARAAAQSAALAGRLWMPPPLTARLAAAHGAALSMLDGLAARLAAARAGFAALPLREDAPAAEPLPVALERAPS
jgi:hypothetical protein